LRVSTDSQDVDSQKIGIVDYATAHGLPPLQFVEEKASGSIPAAERTLGKDLLPRLAAGDLLLVAEISRLGRSLVDILGTLKTLAEKGVGVHVVKSGFVLDGSINSKIITTVLGLAAEIERDLLRQRVREGQARARAAGKRLGRPKAEAHYSKLDKHADVIRTYASRGMTKLNLARAFDCDWTTMNRWLERHNVKIERRAA
jgi:DNA invertase Pin-like site-specific DNA recombinase